MLTYYILIHIKNDLHFLSHRQTHNKNVALTLCRQRLFFILMTVEWMTHDSNNDNRIKLYWRKLNNGHTKLNHISCHKCMSLNFLSTSFSWPTFHMICFIEIYNTILSVDNFLKCIEVFIWLNMLKENFEV